LTTGDLSLAKVGAGDLSSHFSSGKIEAAGNEPKDTTAQVRSLSGKLVERSRKEATGEKRAGRQGRPFPQKAAGKEDRQEAHTKESRQDLPGKSQSPRAS
jgi:hypothetical protein